MLVRYKDQPVSVWEISRTSERPDWVETALAKKEIFWLDNRVRILMSSLNPPYQKKHRLGSGGTVGGGVDALGVYAYGDVGDFLDATNQRVVSRKKFLAIYQIVEDE
ncbi:hypothetical protein [Secundilactobacillus kimchicus]|nr:hypothetical protein [Secundilactobacillus kimchicus]